jgi:tetratricopeptide (TPR) repeat protein
MSQIAATQVSKPRDEQAFERACLILFRELLGDPNVKTNGRRGQRQNGVDIFGFRNQDAAHPVGIQCKLKAEGNELNEKEVREEVAKALTFVPALREFVIVTTAPDDNQIDRVARELTVEKAKSGHGQIAISVWGWNTLEQRISEHGPAMQAFDPSYGPFAKQQADEIHRVGDQQAILIREVGHIRQEIGILSGNNLPGGSTVVQDALESALDAEVDRYRDILNAGKPKTALGLYQALLAKVQSTASGRIRFRIKANIGHCYFTLDDNDRAVHWLLEGFSHAPNEPKAIANKALSMLLSDKFQDAYDYGINELKKDPSNQSLAPMVIQAAARCSEIEDPLPAIPEPLRGLQDVQTTYVDFLRLRNRTPDWWVAARTASKAHPDHKPLLQFKAEADLDEIGHSDEFKRGRQLSTEARNKIIAAADVLVEIWNTRKVSENPARPDGVAACCNLLVAYQALKKRTEAIAVAKEAISLVPDDEPLSERAAIAALEVDDYAFAERLLPKLPSSANAVLVRFQFYAHTANWPKLIEIAQESDGAPEHERPSIRTMGRLASLMVGTQSKDKQHAELESIFGSVGSDLRSNIVVAEFARRLDLKDVSERAYSHAVKIAEKEESLFGRQMLARSAGQREDWSEVIKLLDGHSDGSNDSDELSLSATAFVNENPTRKRALEFFKELDQSVRNLPFFLTAFGLLQSKRGDLPAAAKAFEQALAAEPENLTALRNLYSVYVRQGRSDREALINKHVESLNFKKLKGSALDKMALAHILRDIGQDQRALEWAYEVIGQNRNDSDVALGYFGLIIGRGDQIEIPRPDKVGVDTWVSFQNNLGEKQQFVIENGTDRPADGIFTPEHPFVAPALGLKVGESFSQARQIGKPEVWTILEIKSKYLSALHEVMETFNVRFPEARGFYRVTTQSGDISPILDEVKSHSEKSQAIADLYLEKKIPLSFVVALAHTETIKFASGIAQFGRDISACYGNVPERTAAEDLARAYANKGAVFDCYTAWAAEAIGVLPALQKLFGTLFIPRSAIDELAVIQHELSEYPGPLMT